MRVLHYMYSIYSHTSSGNRVNAYEQQGAGQPATLAVVLFCFAARVFQPPPPPAPRNPAALVPLLRPCCALRLASRLAGCTPTHQSGSVSVNIQQSPLECTVFVSGLPIFEQN